VLAILNFIFGGLGLLCGITGTIMVAGGLDRALSDIGKNQPGQVKGISYADINEQLAKRVPSYVTVQRTSAIIDLVASALLILSGLGLLKLRPWGQHLGFLYAIIQIPHKLLASIYGLVVVLPVTSVLMDDAMKNVPPGFQRQAMEFGMNIGYASGLSGAILSPVYPLLVIVILLLPSLRRALNPAQAPEMSSSLPLVK
jgi:hypothetical protein